MRLRTETIPLRRVREYFRARGKSLSSPARERIGDVIARVERHIIAILAANRGPNILTGSQAFTMLCADPVLGAFAREAAGTFVHRQPRITIASMRAAHPTKKQRKAAKKAAVWAAVAPGEGGPEEHEAEEAVAQSEQSPHETEAEQSEVSSDVAEDLDEVDDLVEDGLVEDDLVEELEEMDSTPRKSKK